jgi:hypothetical protein
MAMLHCLARRLFTAAFKAVSAEEHAVLHTAAGPFRSKK